MEQIASDLVKVLDHFKIKLVVGLAEGAGANIVARFGLSHPDRCIGLVLVHCTSTTAGVMEHFKDKVGLLKDFILFFVLYINNSFHF